MAHNHEDALGQQFGKAFLLANSAQRAKEFGQSDGWLASLLPRLFLEFPKFSLEVGGDDSRIPRVCLVS